MYTNIDTPHALLVITLWLDGLKAKGQLPPDFPLAAVKDAMKMVMENNMFTWGDCYFLQLLGTAMGTSAACMWATIYYAIHEMGLLIPKYSANLMFLVRFIDDMLGLWLEDGDFSKWESFKEDVNDFGILTWEFEEPRDSVDFLDLTISLVDGKVITKTYQKSLNLYQYIPRTSAHPPGMMRGIIYSLMKTYRRQNTHKSDYVKMAKRLFDRHVVRGWDQATMRELILDADRKLSRPKPPTLEALTYKERLFIHLEYHPCDISRKQIRTIYEATCGALFRDILGVKQTTIAYSRPTNVRNLVTKAKLHQAPGLPASKYLSMGGSR